MYILLLHTQVIGLGTLGLVYTLSTEALPRMEATRGKVKAWRVDSLRSGDLEEVFNSKAIVPVSNSDSKIKVVQKLGFWTRRNRVTTHRAAKEQQRERTSIYPGPSAGLQGWVPLPLMHTVR